MKKPLRPALLPLSLIALAATAACSSSGNDSSHQNAPVVAIGTDGGTQVGPGGPGGPGGSDGGASGTNSVVINFIIKPKKAGGL